MVKNPPVLLAGTDGEFDRGFELVKLPFEACLEHMVDHNQDYVEPIKPYPVIQSGTLSEVRHLCSSPEHQKTLLVMETKNPEWTFLGQFAHESFLTEVFGITKYQYLAFLPELVAHVYYSLDEPEMQTISIDFWFFTTGVGRGSAGYATLHRRNKKFEPSFALGRLPFWSRDEYTGRGWARFNAEDVYQTFANLGCDLQDPEFISGRFATIEPYRYFMKKNFS